MTANLDNIRYGEKIAINRKENAFIKQYAIYALDMGKPLELVCLRIYATNSVHYACVWVHGNSIHGSGGGKAGGYGYHRASSAAQEAFKDAGILISGDIGGRGDEAIRTALAAIAEAAGSSNYFLGEAHA